MCMFPHHFESDMTKQVKKNFQLQLKDQLEGQIDRLTKTMNMDKDHVHFLEEEIGRYRVKIQATENQLNAAVTKLLKLQETM
jgi:septal ring factor EnvC (AmiA/AmiB activator)